MSVDQPSSAAGNQQFVHLHVHSEYSLLDGLGKIKALPKRAKELGMSALALTDHGTMYGTIDFYLAAKDAGIKPIIGVETYMARRGMTDKTAEDKSPHHLLLLAKDATGYANLVKLVSAAHLDGFYYKPRIDRALLEQHHEGLIISAACPSGEIARAVMRDDPDEAARVAAYYQDLVGAGNYYLEIMDHGLPDQVKINRGVLDLGRRMGIPVIATNDVHYVKQEDAVAQEILLCIQTNTTLDDPNRMRLETPNFFLRSPQEMAEVFREVPETLSNTLEVAEKCNLEIELGQAKLPNLPFIPDGTSAEEYLSRLAHKGMEERYPVVTDEIRHRLEYELSVIEMTGFPKYILLVWDYVNWARRQGIFCQPRGSAAGSIVLYCLYVADVDPLEYGLTFERFLNPERIQMPDIDMDIQDDRREEVIDYVTRTYGSDHVAQIVTFGRLAAKAAIRDVGRAMGLPLPEVDKVAKQIPTLPVGMTIDRAMEDNPDLKALYDGEAHIKKLIDNARSVEGVSRNTSTHAAGVVVARDPLTDMVPIQKATKGESLVMTQYSMKPVEKMGLLKMDFLGLINLTIVANTLEFIKSMRGEVIELGQIPLNDEETFKLLAEGETTGVFQLEGMGMRRYIRELKPTEVRHIMAMVALYRPGPLAYIPSYIARKEGREKIEYLHPLLEPILGETYGVIVYQDQVIKIVVAVAGFSMGQADVLRWAMGKKIREMMAKQRDHFMEGAKANGLTEENAVAIWEMIEPFAGYAFNKAHAACYGLLSYQTAFLKTHYPVEYMAALLTAYNADIEKVALTLGECHRLGVAVLPPNINSSKLQYNVELIPGVQSPMKTINGPNGQLAIRYGLIGVKNVGEGAIQSMIAERDANGPFNSMEDFCRRVDMKTLNKRVLESLIKSGAMDEFGDRATLLQNLDQTMEGAQKEQKAREVGQFTMFDSMFDMSLAQAAAVAAAPMAPPIPMTNSDLKERLAWEKEALGLYISSHPFEHAAPYLQSRITATSGSLTEELDGKKVVMAGIVSGIKLLTTKKGDRMAAVQMEDMHGSIEVIVFPKTFAKTRDIWEEDTVVVIEGKVDAKEERKKLLVEKAEVFVAPDAPAPEMAASGIPMAVGDGTLPEFAEIGMSFDPSDGSDEEPDFRWEDGPTAAASAVREAEQIVAEAGKAAEGSEQSTTPSPSGRARRGDELASRGEGSQEAELETSRDSHESSVEANFASPVVMTRFNGIHTPIPEATTIGEDGKKNGSNRKPCHFQVVITRHGSDDEDVELLREAYRLLCGNKGKDSYELCVVTGRERTFLEMQGATTGFDATLEAALKQLLGPDSVSRCQEVA